MHFQRATLWRCCLGFFSDNCDSEISLPLREALGASFYGILGCFPRQQSGPDSENIRAVHTSLMAWCLQSRIVSLDAFAAKGSCSADVVDVLLVFTSHGTGTLFRLSCDDYVWKTCNSLREEAGLLLLDAYGASEYVRDAMARHEALFDQCKPANIFPKMLQVLYDSSLKANHQPADSLTICNAIVRIFTYHGKSEEQCFGLVRLAVESIEVMEQKNPTDPDRITSLCSTIGDEWRKALLSNGSSHSFADALISLGRLMFTKPSDALPLNLLARFLGDGATREIDVLPEEAVKLAVVRMLELCIRELQSQEHPDVADSLDQFQRMSPLLLLRRMPRLFYRIAYQSILNWENPAEERYHDFLKQLAHQIAVRLGVVVDGLSEMTYTPEERRLAAEIAGQALPLQLCYDILCMPAFENLLTCLHGSVLQSEIPFVAGARSARAALFAVCQHLISSIDERSGGHCLVMTAVFAAEVLAYDNDKLDEGYLEDLSLLQAGCVDFFALCLELSIREAVLPNKVVEIARDYSENALLGMPLSISAGSRQVIADVMCLLAAESQAKAINTSIVNEQLLGFLWNSFAVAARRLPIDNVCSKESVRLMLGWIVDWGVSNPTTAGGGCSSFCCATALQVVFTLINRTHLSMFDSADEKRDFVSRAHKWAQSILLGASCQNRSNSAVMHSARQTALRLLLLFITIDAADRPKLGFLTDEQVREIIFALDTIARADCDLEIKQFAQQVLGSILTLAS